MSEQDRLESEKLVEIHQARDQWNGNLIIGYLRDNGIEAMFQGDPNVPLEAAEFFKKSDGEYGIFVLEEQAGKARALVKEFIATRADDVELEREAMQRTPLDKQHIGELRQAVREERKTFDFLRLAVVGFLGAMALLWAIWPVFLPEPLPRFTVVVLLVLVALFLGRRLR